MALTNNDSSNYTLDDIYRLYRTPGHPIAFSAPFTIYKYFNGRFPLRAITEALEHNDTYTLHREYKQPSGYNMYYVRERRHQFQADLIDIMSLKRYNRGITFLLVIIDLFSRKLWVMPLRNKSGLTTVTAFRDWIASLRGDLKSPARLLTDSGTEFYNRQVKDLMSSHNIEMQKAKNIHKAAIVERANKTIQILIYKYLTDRGETKYIDVLADLVSGYNNRKHRTLNYEYTPNEADLPSNESDVRSIHILRGGKKALHNKQKRRWNTFDIGDHVRIKTHARAISTARRAYLQQFHGELFTITGINDRMPIKMYFLKSMNTEEDIDGGFYANELVRVRGDLFKIEKILRREGRGRQRRVLVRWKYFDPRWDSWIYERDIVDA